MSRYVGVDFSDERIKQATQRANDVLNGSDHTEICWDLRRPFDLGGEQFEFVSMQFAIHYFFDKPESLSTLLGSVSACLKEGCHFAVTTVDASFVSKALSQNQTFHISKSCSISPVNTTQQHGDAYGRAYSFRLGNCVQDCVECVPSLPELCRVGKSVGLQLVHVSRFRDFYRAHRNKYKSLVCKMGINLSDSRFADAWQIAELYNVYVFRKRLDA